MRPFRDILVRKNTMRWAVGCIMAFAIRFLSYTVALFWCLSLPLPLFANSFDDEITHVKSCLQSIQPHILFFTDLFHGKTDDITRWLLLSKDGKPRRDTLVFKFRLHQKELIKKEMQDHLSGFPFDVISNKMHSKTIKNIVVQLASNRDFLRINDCWKALRSFACLDDGFALFDAYFFADLPEARTIVDAKKRLKLAKVLLKDLTNTTHLLYAHYLYICSDICSIKRLSFLQDVIPGQDNTLMNLLYIYNEIDRLPLENAIRAIDQFVREFSQMLARLKVDTDNNENNNQDENNGNQFISWLKKKWVFIPISVGVIIIKAVYYFWVSERENHGGGHGNFASMFSLNDPVQQWGGFQHPGMPGRQI